MTINEDITLDQYESEDIFDIVAKLEKSFAITFDKEAFINVTTYGDMCDVIERHIRYDHKEDCTKQQAFYKIRTAISVTQQIDQKYITTGSGLVELFPAPQRRRQIKKFLNQLETDMPLLTYPGWMQWIFIIGMIASLVIFFFSWTIALSGIVFFGLTHSIAEKLGNELICKTVGDLAEKLATEHYMEMRSSLFTVNRKEIVATINEAFIKGLAIEKEQLTRDAKFSWA